ncbi:MAG TPA: CARDB domain-containing protein, partial [Chloroflexota bacterium]|nr:CARDB domain-containing protein [Chloroflexota bacterium]
QGAGVTPTSATRFYLSTNAALDAGDTLIASRSVPALAAAASSAVSTSVTIPASTSAGLYYLIAQADGEQVVAETQETNNTAFVLISIGPDLVVLSATVPASAAAGSSITVADTVKNQGGGDAPATTTRFYLSQNSTLDAGDTVLGVRAAAPLAAAGQDSGTSLFTIPAGTAPGIYYLLAKADADNGVAETAETNNLLWRQIQVTP